MTRTLFRGMLFGAIFGVVVGGLVCLSLLRALDQPAYVDLAGLVSVDSASYPDSQMSNRIFLAAASLAGPVYIRAQANAIDINELYGRIEQAVRLRGELRCFKLSTGESVLELEVIEVLPQPQ
ncbi:hypothetical protein IQ265_27600 [Nodosilinea sp. LEGE 06152]|uniref:hypothetical protein n=1 Tax=Nodosilinea sp. LEGE 06152 TaxID=2777966 RepID=UPI001881A70F|nr:hypothetical protein [Nodosilinea sp. LEGE 06152]MBE9160559.1 hypothetical protein [Nodosilinea sp. LEGE 06152]